MTKILLLFALALVFVAMNTQHVQKTAVARRAYVRSLASESDICAEKKFCAVIYVAPWCPACHSMAPQFKNLLARAKTMNDYGVKIVVGQGTQKQNEAEAASYGAGASTDHDSLVKKALDVREFPSFFVMDKERTVILNGQEAFHWINENFR